MKTIKLTQGKEAIVDDDDFERLSKFKWHFTGRYAARKVDGLSHHMHWDVIDCPYEMERDHKNRNKLDNRKSNLRLCTKSQNQMNRERLSNNTTGVKCVHWHKGAKKFIVQITKDGKRDKVRYFKKLAEAKQYAEERIKTLHGEFAKY